MEGTADLNWDVDDDDIAAAEELEERNKIWEAKKIARSTPSQKQDKWMARKCGNCNKIGHLSSYCRHPEKKPKCQRCWQDGHWENSCPNRICYSCGYPSMPKYCGLCVQEAQEAQCQICEGKHDQSNCPDQWRSQISLPESSIRSVPDNSASSKTMYCSNCAEKGHLASSCTEPRSLINSRHPVVSRSIFGSANDKPTGPTPHERQLKSVVTHLLNQQLLPESRAEIQIPATTRKDFLYKAMDETKNNASDPTLKISWVMSGCRGHYIVSFKGRGDNLGLAERFGSLVDSYKWV